MAYTGDWSEPKYLDYSELRELPVEVLRAEIARLKRETDDNLIRDEACKSISMRLESWRRQVATYPGTHLYRMLRDGDPIPEGCQVTTDYQMDLDREKQRAEMYPNWSPLLGRTLDPPLDERPYFHDPCPLGFDPIELWKTDNPGKEEGISLAEVWVDPLARTLWLAIKARHLTSQYFCGACLNQADRIRKNPPKTADELYLSTGGGIGGTCGRFFSVQIFPYVARVLVDEGRWPYLPLPRDFVSPHVLGYKVERKGL